MTRLRADGGQSLVIVLITITAFGILLSSLAGLVSTAAKANQGTTAVVRHGDTADAGAEFGLQKVKAGQSATYAAVPATTTLAGPSVNGDTTSVTVTQRNLASITIAGPATLTVNTSGSYKAQFTEGASTFTLAYGVVWSVTPTAGTTLTQDGVFATSVGATTYTLKAVVNNVSATKTVTVP